MAIVGDPSSDNWTGRAAIYQLSGSVWKLATILAPSALKPGARFGAPAAISNDTAVVSARYQETFTGAAFVFARTGSRWAEQAEYVGTGLEDDGYDVAISDATMAIGAPTLGGIEPVYGHAEILNYFSHAWHETAWLTGQAEKGMFGGEASASANTVVIGEPGQATVYQKDGEHWEFAAAETGPALPSGPGQGYPISLANTDSVVLVGESTIGDGGCVIFVRSGNKWEKAAVFDGSESQAIGLGTSVAVSGGWGVAGAPGGPVGAAYVFNA